MATNQPLPDNSIVVTATRYCTPYQVDLYIARKVLNVTQGNNLGVFDINGNNIFNVKSTGNRRILVDAAGVPIISLQQKKFSAHDRWNVYIGDSSDSKDMLFGVKRSKFVQLKTRLNVFLASNTAEDVCDFKMKQNYRKKSCVIYQGDSQNIIAEMHKRETVQGNVLGKDTFSLTVCPNIDHVFVIALRVVLDEINMAGGGGGGADGGDGGGGGGDGGDGGGGGGCGGGCGGGGGGIG